MPTLTDFLIATGCVVIVLGVAATTGFVIWFAAEKLSPSSEREGRTDK